MKKKNTVARVFSPEAILKRAIRHHFMKLGFTKAPDGTLMLPGEGKEVVRHLHGGQRSEKLERETIFVNRATTKLLPHFAEGSEINPTKIKLRLVRVRSGTMESDLFRFATLTWSVPVSVGFGRRLRYLVWDDGHNRVAGVIALGDPVFNLSVRDNLIGWSSQDRASRLVNVLDAYVLGAVPPYSLLLGGKAVACLVRSKEVFNDFRKEYGKTVGIISGSAKKANLLAVTTTSSMGRSSIYNRLKLDGKKYFEPIGYTVGWGHFHITERLFEEMRKFLRLKGHRYADQHEFGEGPNWRLRTIRAALGELGIKGGVLKHGIQREVFITSFSNNAFEILKTGKGKPDTSELLTVRAISGMAVARWMVPRAERDKSFQTWKRDQIMDLIAGRKVNLPIEDRTQDDLKRTMLGRKK